MILKDYVAESVEKYGLRDEYATQIQLKKQYFNKTQKEEDSISDIEEQAKDLENDLDDLGGFGFGGFGAHAGSSVVGCFNSCAAAR